MGLREGVNITKLTINDLTIKFLKKIGLCKSQFSLGGGEAKTLFLLFT
jgi:hypothetical protein